MITKPDEFSDVRAALIGEREPDTIEWYEYTTRLLAAIDEQDREIARLRLLLADPEEYKLQEYRKAMGWEP